MIDPTRPANPSLGPIDPVLLELVEEFTRRAQAGDGDDLEAFLREHPAHAAALRELLPAVRGLVGLARTGSFPAGGACGADPDGAVLGDYRLVRRIGQGGMGVVYEAVHEPLGRSVALKVLPADAARWPGHVERFRREALAAARLHHTNIVPVHGVGEHAGVQFYVMQFIDGHGLDAVIRRLNALRDPSSTPDAPDDSARSLLRTDLGTADTGPAAADTAPDPGRPGRAYFRNVARIGAQAADALAYAHGQGVLHRDVKPSNLLLDTRGTVWVTDFGVARVEGLGDLTRTGEVVGTLRYLPPERLRGEVDARGDVYSLGLTLYELLALRPAFDAADRVQLLDQVAAAAPPAPRALNPHIPRDLETIVRKAADPDPARRYPTAAALADDLRRFVDDQPIRARPVGPLTRLAKWARRRPAVAIPAGGLAVAILALLVLGGVSYWQINRALGEKSQALGTAETALGEKDRALGEKETALGEKNRALGEKEAALAQERAERDRAERKTYQALFEEARLLRVARPPGWRDRAWANYRVLFRAPAGIGDPAALRDEVVAALMEVDVVEEKRLTEARTGGLLQSVAFSPDGSTLAGAGPGGMLLWDIAADRLDRTRTGTTAVTPRAVVRFHPAGTYLATSGPGNRLDLHGWKGGKPPVTHLDGRGPAQHAVFDRRGRLLAVGWSDQRVTVHDATTGEFRHEFHAPEAGTKAADGYFPVALAPGGESLATSGADFQVVLHPLGEPASPVVLGRLAGPVRCAAFSPDGEFVAAGGPEVLVWEVRTRRLRHVLNTQPKEVLELAFDPAGRLLAATTSGPSQSVWDVETGQPAVTVQLPFRGALTSAFSPDGARLAYGWTGAAVFRVSPLATRRMRTSDPTASNFRVLGDSLVVVGKDPRVRELMLWDPAGGEARARMPLPGPGFLATVECDRQGGRVAAAVAEGGAPAAIHFWDGAGRFERTAVVPNQPLAVYQLAFDPTGTRLAGAQRNALHLWDAVTGELVRSWPAPPRAGHFETYAGIALLADRVHVLAAKTSGEVRVWDSRTGAIAREVAAPALSGVAVSPDRTRLTVLTRDDRVLLFSLPDLGEIRQVPAPVGSPVRAAFSPDGRALAVSGRDGQLVLLDAATLGKEFLLAQESPKFTHVEFSPDGRFLYTNGREPAISVYDLSLIRGQLAALDLPAP